MGDEQYDLSLASLTLNLVYGENPLSYDDRQEDSQEWVEPMYDDHELDESIWREVRARKSKDHTLRQMT